MSAPPYMKLYWGDYFRDTRRLNRLQHAAYLLLLGEMWIQGGKLPTDDDSLAAIALCTADEWAEVKLAIMPFFRISRGKLTQKRLASEMAKYAVIKRKRKTAGRKGGQVSRSNDIGNPEANAKQLPTKPEPEPEPERKKDSEANASANEPDYDKLAWREAVALLVRKGAVTEPRARSLFGKLLSTNGLMARDLWPVIAAAQANASENPASYLTAAAKRVAERRGERLTQEDEFEAVRRRIVEEFDGVGAANLG